MSELTMECPYCMQHLSFDESLIGQEAQCPNCNKNIKLQQPDDSIDKIDINIENASNNENKSKDSLKNIIDKFVKKNHILLLCLIAACVIFLFLANVLLGFILYQQSELQNKLSSIDLDVARIRHEVAGTIKDFKIIDYTWESSYSMKAEFKNAIDLGYEPVGMTNLNSMKGGMFLFIKR